MLPIAKRKQKDADVEKLLREVIRSQRKTERRSESRIDISIVVAIVPLRDGKPDAKGGFVTLTKNISSDGIMLVVNKDLPSSELLVGFPGKGAVSFVTAYILYREPLPLGCFKVGLVMGSVFHADQYPELQGIGQL